MSEQLRSRERASDLAVAGVYRREIHAGIERVWENVRDWEHLPWLHSESFASIELLEGGDWGWHARIGFHGGAESELELVIDAPGSRYVSRTIAGSGAPSEIWTQLESVAPDRTAIEVEFCLQAPPEKLPAIGEAYERLYTQLWTEDEEMMQQRQAMLDARPANAPGNEPLRLGPLAALRRQLPTEIDWEGRRFRIVEMEGALWAHSVVCPHWLGPLNECAIVEGQLVCPWHGYAFDLKTGESAEGRRLRLAKAPIVRIEVGEGGVEEVVVSAG